MRASLKNGRQVAQLSCEYLVFALPATILRRIPITPALPQQQHDAFVRLKYGRATKTLLQFSRRFWRIPAARAHSDRRCPSAPCGTRNEEQRGSSGHPELHGRRIGERRDARAVHARRAARRWRDRSTGSASGAPELVAARQIVWDDDPWARGGYAFFDPAFDPALRSWLARPAGRLFFAGEHTSNKWQGYMNGAIESGRRAAAEVAAVHALMPGGTA